MEFLKDGRKENNGDQCWCKDTVWKGPTMTRFPEPIPDMEDQGHYKDVFDTSNKGDTGEPRPVGDFAPHANLKKLFMANKISVNNKERNRRVLDAVCC